MTLLGFTKPVALTGGAGGLPTAPTLRKTPEPASMLAELMKDDEPSPLPPVPLKTGEDRLVSVLREQRNRLRRDNPGGGIAVSRFITTDVLLQAPRDFFSPYVDSVKESVTYVRNKLAESSQSDLIREAQDHPTEDVYQDRAYFTVLSLASEHVSTSTWRDVHKEIVLSLVCNEVLGFGVLDPLWRDPKVTEIICNGPYDIQAEIAGEIHPVPCLRFTSKDHLMELIERLYRSVGKVLSQSTPRLKGRLHDKSRMFAVHDSIAPDGPNFNIRRHPKGFWTPEAMVRKGASSQEMMTFIGNLVHKGASGFIVGSTSSGKTSMLNAMTGFYKPRARILTLEDNIEMKPNPKKLLAAAMECHEAGRDDSSGGTSMRDLVKAAMQMRPDVIVVGEVTDSAAYDLCQALNTGHAGLSTFHANSSQLSITRVCSLVAQSGLTTIEGATELVAAAFDFIVNVKHFPVDGSRRIVSVDEVGTQPVEVAGRLTLPVHPLWKFIEEGFDKDNKVLGHWEQVGDISAERRKNKMLDLEADLTWEQLVSLSSLPEGEAEA